jgi:hypothetical protein
MMWDPAMAALLAMATLLTIYLVVVIASRRSHERWRARYVDRVAANFGLSRLAGETTDQLKARLLLLMNNPPTHVVRSPHLADP